MGSDACFRIGSTHKVCQDYAIAGVLPDASPFAILSDGCSGVASPGDPGSPHTDFGARFMVRAAHKLATVSCDRSVRSDFAPSWVAARALGMAASAGLGRRAIDATLLQAVVEDGEVVVHQVGDGVVVWRKRDTGNVRYRTVKFGNNMPFYASYLVNDADLAQYLREAKTMEVEEGSRFGNTWIDTLSSVVDMDQFTPAAQTFRFGNDNDLVVLMSDGAESFQRRDGSPVPLREVVDQLCDFRSYTGEFVQRRVHKFMSKFCVENGWTHADDLSVAAIYVGDLP